MSIVYRHQQLTIYPSPGGVGLQQVQVGASRGILVLDTNNIQACGYCLIYWQYPVFCLSSTQCTISFIFNKKNKSMGVCFLVSDAYFGVK